jgi:hypothetical protein
LIGFSTLGFENALNDPSYRFLYNILYEVFFLTPPGRNAKRVYKISSESSQGRVEIAPGVFTFEV